ncbi:hypothetical protein HRED_05748, partial [Candidatus Haloredivivus sp. G17]
GKARSLGVFSIDIDYRVTSLVKNGLIWKVLAHKILRLNKRIDGSLEALVPHHLGVI